MLVWGIVTADIAEADEGALSVKTAMVVPSQSGTNGLQEEPLYEIKSIWVITTAPEIGANIETLSAGTAMVIPSWIMDEYKANSYLYSRPFNYLVDHYTVIGPSYLEEGESTYYIPLTSTEKDNTIPESKITMVDIANIKQHPQDETIFIILQNTQMVFSQLDKL